MPTIRTTDLPARQARTETFLDGSLKVISHSGLHPAEKRLLDNLPRLPAAPASLLVAGNRTGAVAMAAAARFPGCAVTCHTFDLHHARAILRNLRTNALAGRFVHDPFVSVPNPPAPATSPDNPQASRFTVACTASLPAGPYAAALMMATPGIMPGELVLDQLEDLHENLAEGAVALIACEAETSTLLKQIRDLFGGASVLFNKNGICCVSVKRQGALKRRRTFSAAFTASLPGESACTLVSLPGVFCHRRPDTGGLALAEVAQRDLKSGQRVLDMGCGCGLVGLLLARSQPDVRVTFLDSHARAMAATRQNVLALGLAAQTELVLSDSGTDQTGFDLCAGNPPYYSDFRIAELFIRTAHAVLKPGGICLTVAKAAAALANVQRGSFGAAEIISRRGYGIVKSVR